MSKRRLHWQWHMPYPGPMAMTKCKRHVSRDQIAAFEMGVTCKACLAAIAWDKEHEQNWKKKLEQGR